MPRQQPDSDDDFQFATVFTSTAAGSVTFHAIRLDTSLNSNGDYDHGVFLNAFEITEVIPVPAGAWVGLAMFGCMGVGAVRRKFRKA